jgi:hypothetical protein
LSAQVRSLFPAYHNPFYAGFGNRDSDTRTYVSLKVSTHTLPRLPAPCVAPSRVLPPYSPGYSSGLPGSPGYSRVLRRTPPGTPAYSCVLLRYSDVLGRPSALVAAAGQVPSGRIFIVNPSGELTCFLHDSSCDTHKVPALPPVVLVSR